MGVKERRDREKSDTREKILDAAREFFIEKGYDGVTMRQLAERIEYSPTAIYVHFKDKEELFHDLCHEDFARLAEVFQHADAPTDPLARIRHIGLTYIEFGTRFPNHYKLMFMTAHPALPFDQRDHQVKGNPERDAYAYLTMCVQEAMAEARFRPDLQDADLIAQTLWAAVHGVISLEIAKCNDGWVAFRPIAERTALMLDSILQGLIQEGR